MVLVCRSTVRNTLAQNKCLEFDFDNSVVLGKKFYALLVSPKV